MKNTDWSLQLDIIEKMISKFKGIAEEIIPNETQTLNNNNYDK